MAAILDFSLSIYHSKLSFGYIIDFLMHKYILNQKIAHIYGLFLCHNLILQYSWKSRNFPFCSNKLFLKTFDMVKWWRKGVIFSNTFCAMNIQRFHHLNNFPVDTTGWYMLTQCWKMLNFGSHLGFWTIYATQKYILMS